MKRMIVLAGTLMVLFVSVSLVVALNSFGDYGYTYRIGVSPNFSIYNVWGQVNYVSSNTISRFQTYAVHHSGPTISTFDVLKLKGRVWSQPDGGNGCPLSLHSSGQKDWFDGSGGRNVHYLELANRNPSIWPSYSVGKHKLIHPNSVSVSTNASPKSFWVSSNNADNPIDPEFREEWKGIALGCTFSPSLPPDED